MENRKWIRCVQRVFREIQLNIDGVDIEIRAANRTLFSILTQLDHLPRPDRSENFNLPAAQFALSWSSLQNSSMLKKFNLCFCHQCIDTMRYMINHNIVISNFFMMIIVQGYPLKWPKDKIANTKKRKKRCRHDK